MRREQLLPRFGKSQRQANPPLGWWLLGGLVVIVAVSWAFSGNVLVDQLAPLTLGVVALIWLVTWTVRGMGVNR